MPSGAGPSTSSVSWQTPPGAYESSGQHPTRHGQARNGQQQVNMVADDRARVYHHLVPPAASLIAASDRRREWETIFRNPYKVVAAVLDRMAAAFEALHDPVHNRTLGSHAA